MLEKIKRTPLVGALYRLPGLARLYHFILAGTGAAARGFPSRKIFVIGVTGTKGKTTTLELLNAILEEAGKKTALLSSLRVKIGDDIEKNLLGNSMPGRGYIQKFLARAVASRCKYALIEATSQGVLHSRHKFIDWNAGILTNLAPEHIEAHGSFEKYRAAKLEFLRYAAGRGGKIFINADDKNAGFFLRELQNYNPVAYSKNDEDIAAAFPGIYPVRAAADKTPPPFLLADFNKDNLAGGIALALHLGISRKVVEAALRHFGGVPGRMEFVQRRPFSVVIDYAHTPDSLEAIYKHLKPQALNSHQSSKLICVLGAAGGGRDVWKRPEMGKIAAEYCDDIFLTNEDPYDEKPEQIMSEVRSGIGAEKLSVVKEIADRREALLAAVSAAKDGDIIIATGKGSEDWIHIAKGKKIPWNEREVAEEILRQSRI